MKVKDISKAQMNLLASALYHTPFSSAAEHRSKVYCIEQQLDRPLLRPNLLHRIIHIQPPQSHYTTLCWLHKVLNAKVVHELFLLLATEVGLRLNKLVVAGRDRLGHETWDRSILNLRALHGAWLDSEAFWDTFGGALDVPRDDGSVDYMIKWLPKETGVATEKCEACILTRVGSDMDTVFDLDMVLRSRMHTRSVKRFCEPRLLKLVEGWLKEHELRYSADHWWDKRERNRLRASRLKEVRKAIRRKEHAAKAQNNTASIDRSKSHRQKVSEPMIQHEQQGVRLNRSLTHRQRRSLPPPAKSQHRATKSTQPHTTFSHTSIRPHSFHDEIDNDEGEEDDDHDKDIRHTLYATEHDIIDSYAALISTPFLPGMDTSEHQRQASVLSTKHSTTSLNNASSSTTFVDAPSWPKGSDHSSNTNQGTKTNTSHRLHRSQTTRYGQPTGSPGASSSIYSQSSPVSPISTFSFHRQPSNQTSKSQSKEKPHPTPQRSQSTRARITSDQSWITASITPSLASQPNQSNPSRTTTRSTSCTSIGTSSKRAAKYERKFDPIAEESVGFGSAYLPFNANYLVSPIGTRAGTATGFGVGVGVDSPVSPMSFVLPGRDIRIATSGGGGGKEAVKAKDESEGKEKEKEVVPRKSKFREDLNALKDDDVLVGGGGNVEVIGEGRGISDTQRGGRGPKLTSRLSRPFEPVLSEGLPIARVGTVLDSVRRLRQPSPPHRSKSYR